MCVVGTAISKFEAFCRPYDTLEEVVGIRGKKGVGSLMDWGIAYRENQLREDGSIDIHSLIALLENAGESALP